MARRNPTEAVQAARAMLQRAQARARQNSTKEKIVLGGLLIAWLRDDERVRRALLNRIDQKSLRDQDADVLEELIEGLRAQVEAQQAG